MTKLLIKNGIIATLGHENKIIQNGYVLIKDNIISEIGSGIPEKIDAGIEVLDAERKLVMPGFINQHMHFYSTFARGMTPKQPPAKNFQEILDKLWWPLDKALNEEDIYYSTMIPAISGIKKGVTAFFDHHESQSLQEGSLDVIEKALRYVGARGVLSLGISDRYGKGDEGIEENIRFISKTQKKNKLGDDLIRGMFGYHAMFTVEDESMYASSEAAQDLGVGFHIHVGEGAIDQEINKKKYGKTVVERLKDAKCLGEKTIAVHGVFLSDNEMTILSESKTPIVHCPMSNMNNAIGVAHIIEMLKKGILVGLGTDGMSPGVLDDVRVANLVHKLTQKDPRVFFAESCRLLLENNTKIASRHFDRKIGILEKNAYADVIVVDYDPPTPFNEGTFFGHFLFGICEAQVDTTIVNGKVLMKNKKMLHIDEAEINRKSREQASDFWKRF